MHCAKCGAKLIGTRKFCTACGTPAGDPRSSASAAPADNGQGTVTNPNPSIQYSPSEPMSQVNPFAQTAGGDQTSGARGDEYGPPPSFPRAPLAATAPGIGDPSKGPRVSPLAVSNVDSQRGSQVEAIAASSRTPEIAGTLMMPSAPKSVAPDQAAPKARPDRTQLLNAFPQSAARPSQGNAPASTPSAKPQTAPLPVPPAPTAPQTRHQPAAPSGAHSGGWQPHPSAGASYPAQPAAGYASHSYGYAPGARVMVTWSNGQQYLGTVMQAVGTQYLVVFPDGQHHWVDAQYMTPS